LPAAAASGPARQAAPGPLPHHKTYNKNKRWLVMCETCNCVCLCTASSTWPAST
jgi:hypothetical protein